jgi:hypothetical protein
MWRRSLIWVLLISMGVIFPFQDPSKAWTQDEDALHKVTALIDQINRDVSPMVEEGLRIFVGLKGVDGPPALLGPVIEILRCELSQSKLFKVVDKPEVERTEALLEVRIMEFANHYILKATLVDALNGSILASATTYIKRCELRRVKDLTEEIRQRLALLEQAIYNYMVTNSEYEVVWPKSLDELVPDYLTRIPDPIKGEWIYDPTSGRVHNSAYPGVSSGKAHLNLSPIFKRKKEAKIRGNLGLLRSALAIYWGDNQGEWPKSLEELVPLYIERIPSPIEGFWEYNPQNGNIRHSLYPEW